MFRKKKDLDFEMAVCKELGEIQGIVIQQRIEIEKLKKSVETLKRLSSKEEGSKQIRSHMSESEARRFWENLFDLGEEA